MKYQDHITAHFRIIPIKPALDGDKNVQAHRHNYYELFLFETGGGNHHIDFQSYSVDNQSIHIVPPGSVHLLRRNETTRGYVILLSRDYYFTEMNAEIWQHPNFFLTEAAKKPVAELHGQYALLNDFIVQIQAAMKQQNPYQFAILRHYAIILLLKIQQIVFPSLLETPELSNQQRLFYNFKQLLEKHFKDNWTTKDFADALLISTGQLNDLTKKTVGKSARQLFQERLLLEAKRLILHSDLSSKAIAYELNFTDPSYFCRYFKKQTNYTTQDFRAAMRQEYDWVVPSYLK